MDKPAITGGKPVSKEGIPFTKVIIGDEEVDAVLEVLRTKAFVNGEYTKKLEREFARYIGTKHAIAVSNGTDGLFLAYLSLGLTFRKKICTTPITFIATASTIIHTGAIPVFSDIKLDGNIDPSAIGRCKNLAAISIVHLFGLPVDYDEIQAIANDLDIPIIEDASHAHGAEYKGRKIGTLGKIAVFSFYPSKIIAAGGWGGIITTNDAEIAEKIRLLRAHGELRVLRGSAGAYEYIRLGYNLRISEAEAAVAYYQLKKLDRFVEERRKAARKLIDLLGDVDGLLLPTEEPNKKHAYYIFNIILDPAKVGWDRDSFVQALNAEGVGARRGYHIPLHKTTLFRNIRNPEVNHFAVVNADLYPNYNNLSLSNAEYFAANSVWLPIFPGITEEQVEIIARAVKKLIAWKTKKSL